MSIRYYGEPKLTKEALDFMSLEEFEKKYMQGQKDFDFDKFEITCKKCGSKKIEFGGVTQSDDSSCYYRGDTPILNVFFVCKCRDCGNSFALQKNETFE